MCVSVLLINLYGAPLAQRGSYLVLHSSLFGLDGAVNYDYIVTNSINSCSRYISIGAHTNHASKHIKNSGVYVHV